MSLTHTRPSIGHVPSSPLDRVAGDALRGFFAAMPKAELHCHLLGAVKRETFTDLVAEHRAPLSAEDIASFYERGEKPVGVLRVLRALEQHLLLAPDNFRRIAYEYLAGAAAENVRHAEFFWNPTASLRTSGLRYPEMQAAIVTGMRDAQTDYGITSVLIPSIDREASPAEAVAMVEAMLAARDERVGGIGIDYGEIDRPPELFADAFALARRAGLRATAHAGEFGTSWRNVATAVDVLGVDRVDHGYTIVDNPDLARRYADRGIVFTVVPTNSYYMRTLAPDRWALDHPIRRMAELGLRLHPNTDDPTLHAVSPAGAWELMYTHLGFELPALRAMMLNGIDGAWMADAVKAQWKREWGVAFDDRLATVLRS
ncbi:adenosine deaminase family protein [Sphingomonas glacialis]|uniref:Adenosine deaminase n=1 Tax=Sphingomonas glacialis TaxID=658225 RepID=A0A502FCV4_9SPHN|nr:adenosine deaminase [Sphingomonas glacialis]TPG47166.1 adenosine deaminase [Sphingomonas glacialis]